ncbi:MAG: hypothetical protein ACRD1C_00700 [Terriglobales bacterium]
MTRKRKPHYKLLPSQPVGPQLSARARAIVTIVQWAFWFALAGILVAFFLILSLFTHYRLDPQVWLRLWPASIRLMTADPTATKMGRLALRLTLENGLFYGAAGFVLGFLHVGFRSLRRRLQPRYN